MALIKLKKQKKKKKKKNRILEKASPLNQHECKVGAFLNGNMIAFATGKTMKQAQKNVLEKISNSQK